MVGGALAEHGGPARQADVVRIGRSAGAGQAAPTLRILARCSCRQGKTRIVDTTRAPSSIAARLRNACALCLCVLASGAGAAALPDATPYKDSDPAASYLQPPPGMRSKFRASVNAALMKNPRTVAALTHRGYLFLEGGDIERAVRDFDAAAAAAAPGSAAERHLLWSRGWANYDLGRYDDTLRDWQRAVQLHGGHPFWAGYSLALVYWSLGQADTALAWFDATVASDPQWGGAAGLDAKIAHWNRKQQDNMRALHAAWCTRNRTSSATGSTR
jgi:tetratricopeptide (TPR) repeat protein